MEWRLLHLTMYLCLVLYPENEYSRCYINWKIDKQTSNDILFKGYPDKKYVLRLIISIKLNTTVTYLVGRYSKCIRRTTLPFRTAPHDGVVPKFLAFTHNTPQDFPFS